VSNELDRAQKENVAYFKILTRHLPIGTRNHEIPDRIADCELRFLFENSGV
jgi:hypothetical protein